MQERPYEAVVVGSLGFGELLGPLPEPVLEALAQGLPVWMDPRGLPESPANRVLAGAISGRKREIRSLGIGFLEGKKSWITAREAAQLRDRGLQPQGNSQLTPLAREILEGSD